MEQYIMNMLIQSINLLVILTNLCIEDIIMIMKQDYII